MKSKMNIKSIITMAAVSVMSFVFLNMSCAANTAKISVDRANLRESASSDSSIVDKMNKDEEVEVLENVGEWSKVRYKEDTGYVKTELLNISTTEENTQEQNTQENTNNEENVQNANENNSEEQQQNTENLAEKPAEETQNVEEKFFVVEDINIKLVPLINATNMNSIQKDQEVSVEKTINGWSLIEIQSSNIRGWVREEKIISESKKKEAEELAKAEQEAAEKAAKEEAEKNAPAIKKSFVQIEKVNLRKENNTNAEIIGKLPKNTEVEVLEENAEWSKCRVNGLIGYISTQYLGSEKVEDVQEEVTSRGSTKAREVTADTQLHDIAATTSASGKGAEIAAFAKTLVGKSYAYGATGPNSFDCSGLTSYVFAHFGVGLPHSSESQRNCGTAVDRSALAPGDLVCYRGHVAIYIGGGQVVHASTPKSGVCVSTVNGAKPGAYITSRRLV